MGVKLAAASGGSIELVPTNTASAFTVTVPAGTGTLAVQGVSTNIVSGTAVASTSGTSIDFTAIPSWVVRITIMFNNVSTSGTSSRLIQLIYGGTTVVTSGYRSSSARFSGAAVAQSASTAGFFMNSVLAADDSFGIYTLTNVSGNIWVGGGGVTYSGGNLTSSGGVTLSGTLTGVRITTVNGTDTFDAGSVNILYE